MKMTAHQKPICQMNFLREVKVINYSKERIFLTMRLEARFMHGLDMGGEIIEPNEKRT